MEGSSAGDQRSTRSLALTAVRCAAASAPLVSAPDPHALRSSAEVAAAKGDTVTALKLYTALLDAEPSQINYFHRAGVYLKKHQYAHAISDLNRAMELDSKFFKGMMLRAKVYKVTGMCEAALEDVRTILAAQPTHKEASSEKPKVEQCVALVQQARALLAAHQHDQAKHTITQALDIAYDSHKLLLMRIEAHTALRDWQSILVDTRKILQNDKSSMDALYIRGRAYYFLGEHDNALTHYKEGLRLDPEHKAIKEATKALKLLVRRIANTDAALQQNNGAEALEEIEAALSMDPQHTVIRPGLLLKKTEALLKLKRWAAARDLASELITADENNVDAYCKRAEAKLGLEEFDQAVADYTKATQINPQHQAATQGLHHAQLELKKSQQKDYYKELGIPRNANARAIKKAYRKAALLWHPDKHEADADKTLAEKKFQAIAEAYEVLSDPEIKGKYDRGEEVSEHNRTNEREVIQRQRSAAHLSFASSHCCCSLCPSPCFPHSSTNRTKVVSSSSTTPSGSAGSITVITVGSSSSTRSDGDRGPKEGQRARPPPSHAAAAAAERTLWLFVRLLHTRYTNWVTQHFNSALNF